MSSSGSGNRQTLTADGQTTEKSFIGPVRMSLSGTFGGGTAVLRARDPSGAFVNVEGGSFTAAKDQLFDFPVGQGNILDVDLSGSTTPALVVWLQGKKFG